MTIYILDDDPAKCAQALDDKSLDKMIRDIAQTLCNVHYIKAVYTPLKPFEKSSDLTSHVPLPLKNNAKGLSASHDEWTQWARECVANYEYLVRLGVNCCSEKNFRHDLKLGFFKEWEVINWARDNVPILPVGSLSLTEDGTAWQLDEYLTPLPFAMPSKYIVDYIDNSEFGWSFHTVESYRNYYQGKLKRICPTSMCEKTHKIKWTRREKPSWLNL